MPEQRARARGARSARQARRRARAHGRRTVCEQPLELLAAGADLAPLVAAVDHVALLLEDEHVVAVVDHVRDPERARARAAALGAASSSASERARLARAAAPSAGRRCAISSCSLLAEVVVEAAGGEARSPRSAPAPRSGRSPARRRRARPSSTTSSLAAVVALAQRGSCRAGRHRAMVASVSNDHSNFE